MPTLLDHRWGMVAETSYGTAVTVSRFYPRTDDCKHTWDPRRRQGVGITSGGRRAVLGARTYLPSGKGEITIKIPIESKAAGVLLNAAFGVSTVTTVTGGAQMNFTDQLTGTTMPSSTIQFVDAQNDGTEVVTTFAGCVATKVDLDQGNEDALMLGVTFDALSRTTATAAATKSYTYGTIFDAFQATHGLTGTLTVPTTTALATGLTAFNDVRSWKLSIDQKMSLDRWNINGGVRAVPVAGLPAIKFSAEIEHNATTLPAALVAGTILPWYTTYTTTETLSAGFTQLQVVLPQIALTKGNQAPKVDGSVSTFSIDGDVKNNGTGADVYLVYRSTDTAL